MTSLEQLYLQELGRAPDASGLSFYQNALDSGTKTIEQIQRELDASAEGSSYNQSLATMSHTGYGSPTTSTSTSTSSGSSYTPTTSTSTSSGGWADPNASDYQNIGKWTLEDLYRAELGRAPDASGLSFYQNLINQGASMDDIRAQLNASAEGQQYDTASAGKLINPITGAIVQGTPEEYANYWAQQSGQSGNLGFTGTQPMQDPNQFSIQNFMIDQLRSAGATAQEIQQFMASNVLAPTAVAAQAQARGYTPETIAGQDMSKYMNPYTQEVIDQSLADLERQRQMQTNALGYSATQAGAFGGSRHGVAEALTNEGFARQGGQLAANLRNQGYGQALQTAGADVGMMNQAGQFGAGAANQASLANAAAQTGVSQFNANTNLAAQQANQNAATAAAGMNLQAANSGANMANLGFGWQNTLNTNMFNQGLAQQQMNQQLINNAMQQYQMYQNQPNTSLGYMGTAMGSFPSMGTTTQTGSPSLLDVLGTGLYGLGALKPAGGYSFFS